MKNNDKRTAGKKTGRSSAQKAKSAKGARKQKNKKGAPDSGRTYKWIIAAAALIAVLAAGYLILVSLGKLPSPFKKQMRAEDLPYREEVAAASKEHGVEQARIYAVIQVESSFKEDARSPSGALGLMQMLPSTYEEHCLQAGVVYDPEDLKKPEVNIPVCTEYLAKLHEMTGSWAWAHVAYFAGIGNVNKWMSEGLSPREVPMQNARTYLERIESAYDAYEMIFRNSDETGARKALSDCAHFIQKTGLQPQKQEKEGT